MSKSLPRSNFLAAKSGNRRANMVRRGFSQAAELRQHA
ncbi:hypothetical protein Z945_1816 [Sulfitobacter noctilucae]|nr:hypothetical protein Z945_1816 [Sulfitobacter noctilucae]